MAIVLLGVNVFPKATQGQTTNSSNVTSDDVERMMAQSPQTSAPMIAVSAPHANNYSAWILFCKAPPITSAEKDCDPIVRLH